MAPVGVAVFRLLFFVVATLPSRIFFLFSISILISILGELVRLDRFSHYVCLSLYLSLVGLFFVVNCVLCSVPRSPHFLVLHLHGLTPPPVYSHSVCLPWNSFSFLLYLLEIFSMLPSGPAQVLCLLSPSAPPLALAIQLHEKFHSRFFERNASVKKKKREQNREKNW